MTDELKQVYEFDEFRLDVMKRQLTRTGEVVALSSKAFDLLLVLVQNGGRDLAKDELLESVWPGQILEEANLTVNMSAVRKALGERATRPRYIITIPGRGYRFVGGLGNSQVGLVIESQSISQILVEEESESDDGARGAELSSTPSVEITSPDTAASSMNVASPAKQLTTQISSQSFFKHWAIPIALIFGSLVMVLAVVFALHEIRQSRARTTRFQQIKLQQLTNDGMVVTAAVSPDGKFFVFVHAEKDKRSLRLGQMNGQGPVELRPSSAVIYRGVAFAPDGNSVYYSIEDPGEHSESLFRLPLLGGVPEKLRDNIGGYFAIAPDNKRVAFVRDDAAGATNSIIVSNLDSSNERVVLNLPANRNLNSINLCWSPDGTTIALGATINGTQTGVGIHLLNVASGELKPLTSPLWREMERVAWLEDGSGLITVAASSGAQEDRQVWFVALPSGDAHRITNDLSSYDIGLSVTADSNSVLAVEHQQINNIWVAPVDDLSKAKQLTFGALNRGDGGLGLDWTPNGRIVYSAAVAKSWTIWIMDADGANARELTPPGASESTPSVTGDGRYIVFDSDRSGSREIWRVNVDGTEPKALTTCGRNFQPNATPDGKWVVYRSACDATNGLWRVSIDGGQPTRLTDSPAAWPWVSPDSKLIACEYSGEGRLQLAVISIEGGPPVKRFEVPPHANFRFGIRWTTDGKAITYRDWDAGVWRQSIDGGAPQRLQGLPNEKIYSNSWSRDGKFFAFTRGTEIRDVVLISNSN